MTNTTQPQVKEVWTDGLTTYTILASYGTDVAAIEHLTGHDADDVLGVYTPYDWENWQQVTIDKDQESITVFFQSKSRPTDKWSMVYSKAEYDKYSAGWNGDNEVQLAVYSGIYHGEHFTKIIWPLPADSVVPGAR